MNTEGQMTGVPGGVSLVLALEQWILNWMRSRCLPRWEGGRIVSRYSTFPRSLASDLGYGFQACLTYVEQSPDQPAILPS